MRAAKPLWRADLAHCEARVLELERENQRLLDLVRFCRHDLYDRGLVTDDEYAALVSSAPGHAAVARLESYDNMRAHIAQLEQLLREERARVR